ncbi:MAG: alginate export family protein [Vicinamibacterales bacterium]|nr:alginate export family protein [Vicinamibacterales bacterium]
MKTTPRVSWIAVALTIAALGASATGVTAQDAVPPEQSGGRRFTLTLALEAGAQGVGEWGAWWNFARVVAPPTPFAADRSWFEIYAKPGVRIRFDASHQWSLFGSVSVVGSANVGHDVFGEGDSGRVLLEDAVAGVRYTSSGGTALELSGGAQRYTIASGMLISVGASNGFERGATTLFPRKAWQMTGVARVSRGRFRADAFYLDPNELASSDSKTKLAGVQVNVTQGKDGYIGAAYITALQSDYLYIKARLTLIPNGREGLNVLHGFARVRPVASAPGLLGVVDVVREWNGRIDRRAWAVNAEVANTFHRATWTPTLAYAFRYFSGDDPATPETERFDPLFYDGGPTGFAAGSNGSMAFYNANVNLHRVRASLVASARDLIDVLYFHVRASETNSPIQFG